MCQEEGSEGAENIHAWCDGTTRSRPIFMTSFLLPKFQKIRDRVNT